MCTSKIRKILFTLVIITGSIESLAQNKALSNANWFDGYDFRQTELYISDGRFTLNRPSKIDESIDLTDKFIIPPLAEVHTHAFSSTYQLPSEIDRYITQGILYVQVLGGFYSGQQQAKPFIDASPLEVKYTNGGITCSLGHPFTIYEPLAMGIHSPTDKRNRAKEIRESRLAENDAYWFFDTRDDVQSRWEELMSTKPDAIKFMILDIHNYDSLYQNENQLGGKGVSKEVAREIISKSKASKLRTFAHIETASDFEFAVEIGVDFISHIPGYAFRGNQEERGRFSPTQKSLELAKKRGISIITTMGLAPGYNSEYVDGKKVVNKERFTNTLDFQRQLLQKLKNNDLQLLIGSDKYGETLLHEILYLSKHNLLTPREILSTVTSHNAKAIFPGRKIGEIREGYEADFLVLSGNPLVDIENLKNVENVFKSGKIVSD